eukprot:m.197992 g.197992  ORF g.197992 m.197992 type:complete len:594 (-) comp18727_c0_seq1:551-2332(-)
MAERSGVVLENTPIVVDRWVKTEGARLFFLTHAHTDHTQGLHKRWCCGQIFCTEITKKLIQLWFEFPDEMFVLLVAGEARKVSLDNVGKEYMTVTPFDANHCPGAVMYLFEGYFGTVLCTGDFRYCKDLHDPLARYDMDRVFLDNTYLYSNQECPPRAEATRLMLKIIHKHPHHKVYIGLTNIGKERLLQAIHAEFGEVIKVSNERARVLSACGVNKSIFTSDYRSKTRFVVVPQAELASIGKKFPQSQANEATIRHENPVGTMVNTELNSDTANGRTHADEAGAALVSGCENASHYSASDPIREPRILRIRPTGFVPFAPTLARIGRAEADQTTVSKEQPGGSIEYIPYSDHSTRQELVAFITMVRPAAITPIVRSTHGDIDVLHRYCKQTRKMTTQGNSAVTSAPSKRASKRVDIPTTVKEFMLGSVANVPTKRGWGECGRNAFEHLQYCYSARSTTSDAPTPTALAMLQGTTTTEAQKTRCALQKGVTKSELRACTNFLGPTGPSISFDEPPKRIRMDQSPSHQVGARTNSMPWTQYTGLVAVGGQRIKCEPDAVRRSADTCSGDVVDNPAEDEEDESILAMYASLSEVA